MCRVPSCKTRVIGRELGLHEPQIPAREQHLPRLPHLQRGHQHTAILLSSPEPFGWWAMSYPLIEGSNGAPTSRSYVYRSGNAGSPMGRESYGDGVSIVVSGRESRLQGEGRQVAVTQRSKRARCVQAETPREADHWRAGCDRKTHARFGKGPKEKGQKWYLVGGLLHGTFGFEDESFLRGSGLVQRANLNRGPNSGQMIGSSAIKVWAHDRGCAIVPELASNFRLRNSVF